MADFTIRYIDNRFQLSTLNSSNAGGYGYVEVIFIRVARFSSLVRGKKFFWVKGLDRRVNPFDDCISYLGRLQSGGWLTDEDYERFVALTFKAWKQYDASMEPSPAAAAFIDAERMDYAMWSDPIDVAHLRVMVADLDIKAREQLISDIRVESEQKLADLSAAIIDAKRSL